MTMKPIVTPRPALWPPEGRLPGPPRSAGIHVHDGRGTVLRDNLSGDDIILSQGLYCSTAATIARGNVVQRLEYGLVTGTDTGRQRRHRLRPDVRASAG